MPNYIHFSTTRKGVTTWNWLLIHSFNPLELKFWLISCLTEVHRNRIRMIISGLCETSVKKIFPSIIYLSACRPIEGTSTAWYDELESLKQFEQLSWHSLFFVIMWSRNYRVRVEPWCKCYFSVFRRLMFRSFNFISWLEITYSSFKLSPIMYRTFEIYHLRNILRPVSELSGVPCDALKKKFSVTVCETGTPQF